jgi:hypothetical protein
VSKIEEVAARVQKQEGPSRGLDIAIAQAVWPQLSRYAPYCVGDEPIFWEEPFRKQPCPEFTSSLDAALRLVPDGHDWIVASVNGQVGGTPYACVGGDRDHYADTPVLSLVLACLRARLAAPTSVGAA